MLELFWQAITSGLLRVVLPETAIIVVTLVALSLVNLAAVEIDRRFIAPIKEDDRRADADLAQSSQVHGPRVDFGHRDARRGWARSGSTLARRWPPWASWDWPCRSARRR